MSSGEYDVQIDRPTGVQTHRVTVGAGLLADVPAAAADGVRIVTAAFEVLDERLGVEALPSYVDLADYRTQPGFVDAVRERVGRDGTVTRAPA